MYPFERLTERAKNALALAQKEAERSHQSYIGTEHLLIGVCLVREGVASKVLTKLGIGLDDIGEAIRAVGSDDPRIVRQIIPTSRVKNVIESGFREANKMGDHFVGTEHVLLGMLIEGEGLAAHVLQDRGAGLEVVRSQVELIRRETGPEESRAPGASAPNI